MPLLASTKRRRVILGFRGESRTALAFGDPYAFRVALSRQDLRVLWSGEVVGWVRGWAGDGRLVVDTYDESDDRPLCRVWSLESKSVLWQAEADWAWPAGDEHVLIGLPSRIELRSAAEGTVVGAVDSGARWAAYRVGGVIVAVAPDAVIRGLSFPDCRALWEIRLPREFVVERPRAIRCVWDDRGARSVVVAGGADVGYLGASEIGLIEVNSGNLVWTRRGRFGGIPVLSGDRIGCVGNGLVHVLDAEDGRVIVSEENALPTAYEWEPTVHGDAMVVVDPAGRIGTVSLRDGRVVGFQQERGVGFSGCASIDGRLLVTGGDGALWVYEPSDGVKAASRTGTVVGTETAATGRKTRAAETSTAVKGRGRAKEGRRVTMAKAKKTATSRRKRQG